MGIKENFIYIEQEIRDREWTYILGKITQLRIHARDRASVLAQTIKRGLYDTYSGDLSSLKRDIFSIEKSHSRASVIFEKILLPSFFLIEKSDSDDPFLISDAGVISDFSYDCSQDRRTRTFDQEAELHWNKNLAKKAIKEILSYGDSMSRAIFWQFSKQENSDFLVKDLEMKELENLYKTHGVAFLRSLEFLEWHYIDEKADIFGTPYASREPSKRLILVQGFNPVKQIFFSGDGSKAIEDFKASLSRVKLSEENILLLSDILLFIILFIMIMLYIIGSAAIRGAEGVENVQR